MQEPVSASPSSFEHDVTRVGLMQSKLKEFEGKGSMSANLTNAFDQADLESGQPHHFKLGTDSENRLIKINTFVWGRIAWTANHMFAATYPENPNEQTKRDAINYYTSQASLLPCQEECGPAWREELKQNPPDVSSRAALMEWLRLRHNAVNAKLGGPQYSHFDMLATLAEQKEALTAVIYYAKKDDYEALKQPVTLKARISHEWTKLVEDPSVWAAVITGVVLGLIVLMLWMWSKL